ncbi:hypothetical protein CVT26_011422, partial [Gymnopilus dilepis]
PAPPALLPNIASAFPGDLATDGSLANSTAVLTAPIFVPSHVSSQFLTSNRNELSRPRAASPGVSANRIAATSRPVPPPRRRQAGEPGAKQMASKDLRENPQHLCGGMKRSEADRIGFRSAQPDNEIEGSTTRQRRTGTQGSEETKTTNSVCFGNQDSSGRRFILSSVHGMETKVRDECEERDKAGINQDVEHEQSDLTSDSESKSKMSLAFGAPNRKKKAAPPETERVYYPQGCPRCSSLGLPCFIPRKSRASKRSCWHCTSSRAKCPFTANTFMAPGGHDVPFEDDEGGNGIVQANAQLRDEIVQLKDRAAVLIDLYKARTDTIEELVRTYTRREETLMERIRVTMENLVHSAVERAFEAYRPAASEENRISRDLVDETLPHSALQSQNSFPLFGTMQGQRAQSQERAKSSAASMADRSDDSYFHLPTADRVSSCTSGVIALDGNDIVSDAASGNNACPSSAEGPTEDPESKIASDAAMLQCANISTSTALPWSRCSSPASSLTDISEEEDLAALPATPRRSVRNATKRPPPAGTEALPSKKPKKSSSKGSNNIKKKSG